MDPYIHAARWFALSLDPFTDLTVVMYTGIKEEFGMDEDEDDDLYVFLPTCNKW